MTVKRNEKGHILPGQALNPKGRPPNDNAKILAAAKQIQFIETFYGLLDATADELKRIANGVDSTNLQRIAARLLYDCMRGEDLNYQKLFLKLLGINVDSPTNILIHTLPDGDGDQSGAQTTHAKIVDVIQQLREQKKAENG